MDWGEIDSFAGFDNEHEFEHPIRFEEDGATGFITSSLFQALSEPVILMNRPKRGGLIRCVLRAFVGGIARGPSGEPSPLGGYHVVEFGGTYVQSDVFLRSSAELPQGQREEARHRIAILYDAERHNIVLRHTPRNEQGAISLRLDRDRRPASGPRAPRTHRHDVGHRPGRPPRHHLARDAGAERRARRARPRPPPEHFECVGGGYSQNGFDALGLAPHPPRDQRAGEGELGLLLHPRRGRPRRTRVFSAEATFAGEDAANTFVHENADQCHIQFQPGGGDSAHDLARFTSPASITQSEDTQIAPYAQQRGGGSRGAGTIVRRDDSHGTAQRGAGQHGGQWPQVASRTATRAASGHGSPRDAAVNGRLHGAPNQTGYTLDQVSEMMREETSQLVAEMVPRLLVERPVSNNQLAVHENSQLLAAWSGEMDARHTSMIGNILVIEMNQV